MRDPGRRRQAASLQGRTGKRIAVLIGAAIGKARIIDALGKEIHPGKRLAEILSLRDWLVRRTWIVFTWLKLHDSRGYFSEEG